MDHHHHQHHHQQQHHHHHHHQNHHHQQQQRHQHQHQHIHHQQKHQQHQQHHHHHGQHHPHHHHHHSHNSLPRRLLLFSILLTSCITPIDTLSNFNNKSNVSTPQKDDIENTTKVTDKVIQVANPKTKDEVEVLLAIILPDSLRFQFSSRRIMPAIDVTISRLTDRGIFPKDMIKVEYADSRCSSQYAPIEAFNFMTRPEKVHAFLGPVCDFALAPVARYAAVWNVPILSPGGLAHDFGHDKNLSTEYQSLTRNGPSFNSMALVINEILRYYNWTKLHILYEVNGFPDVVDSFCYLAASSLVYWSKHRTGSPFTFSLIYPDKGDFYKTLRKEVGLETGGRKIDIQ